LQRRAVIEMDRGENLTTEQGERAWTREIDFVLDTASLTRALNDALALSPLSAARGGRALREGDVYWLIWADRPRLPRVDGPGDLTARFARACGTADEVWDVTGGARQAAKINYSRAARRARA
jgi:hypothetical protein